MAAPDAPPPRRATGSLAETAYGQLRSAIRARRFQPGDRMREHELAEWLGISRTPVRDALRQLEAEGVLEAARGRGLVVASLDQRRVTEIYAVREALEGMAARLAARQATPAEVAALRDSLERQAATPPEDVARLAQLNQRFHATVYRASHNRYLGQALEALDLSLTLLPGTTYAATERPSRALIEHAALVDAIEVRADDVAESVAREHIRAAERIRLLMIAGDLDGGA